MLTEVRNQIKVIFLSLKYNIMREMTNKVTFVSNVLFMILNNSSFIIQWVVLFSLKQEIGGYTMKEIILLWGIASGTFGISRIVFSRAFELSELIIEGKLDTFLVQPKNVFLSAITSETKISAIPGGLGGVASIRASRSALDVLKFAWDNGKYVAAICAGPTVLADLGITDGLRATCYPGQEENMGSALMQKDAAVVTDGRVITGTSAGCAVAFGLALVEALKGKEAAEAVRKQIVIR